MGTVIVATHNRRELALRLLGALARQRGSGEGQPFEVVVVADSVLSAADIHFTATAVRRRCFDAEGGYDAASTADGMWRPEDRELAYRLLRRGCRVVARRELDQ